MAWYDEAVFYHIYPLGLSGAPKQNDYGEPVHRLNTLLPWIGHLKKLGLRHCISARFSSRSDMDMRPRITGSWTAVWGQMRI